MRNLSDLQQRILKEEFPNMSLESDSDIERYFELRSIGRQSEALDLYDTRIKRKYPDEKQRTLLMKYYRSHDPRFQDLLYGNLVILADRIISRTTYIIGLLTKEIDSVDMTDAYAVIKLAEGLLSIISPDRYIAISFTEKYVRYAKSLDFRFRQMERTAELIRQYVTDTIESVEELKREKEVKRKQHIRQQQQRKTGHANFDLSRIVFSASDINRILIPSNIVRTEDQVIAYCLRYWILVNDPAFEKTVFLYSRKYGTRHSDIFLAIKNGRNHEWKDEEILNSVLSNVVTGYYYNISGDLYLQRTWARYKTNIQGGDQNFQFGISSVPPQKKKYLKKKRQKNLSVKRKSVPVVPFKPEKTPKHETGTLVPKTNPVTQKLFSTGKNPINSNSIADILKKMTGKTYTVYKDLFFKSIRPAIRQALSSTVNKKGSLFDTKQNTAEELVYKFLFDHYNDPYQNWQKSAEFRQTVELGYQLSEIEPIIARWIRDNP